MFFITTSQTSFSLSPAAPDLVVDVAISEHCVEVLDALLGVPVVVVLQTFLYCAHVHRSLDDLVVVLGGEHVERV